MRKEKIYIGRADVASQKLDGTKRTLANEAALVASLTALGFGIVEAAEYVIDISLPCIHMPAIDRSLSDCIVYTCRRLIDLSNDCRYTEEEKSYILGRAKFVVHVFDAVCFVYTCRRLIDLSLLCIYMFCIRMPAIDRSLE